MTSLLSRLLPSLACLALFVSPARAADAPIVIHPGAGTFVFVDKQGDAAKRQTVYTYLPRRLEAKEAPIVFVLHGHGKNAPGYRDHWGKEAEKYGFMAIVPHFDAKQWPGNDYAYPALADKRGKPTDATRWSFAVIEHLFDAIKAQTGNTHATYRIYGHSEGGQYLHRMLLLFPEARYERAVVANPGWYTMPHFDVAYPYGLAGTPVTKASLAKVLRRDVVVLLGTLDNDPDHDDLRRTPEAMAQGRDRNERGKRFYAQAKQRAAELGVPFGWSLRAAPGGKHSDGTMAPHAAATLAKP
jgi:hypothetical protein